MLDSFHPAVSAWFEARFGQPSLPQRRGWPVIAAGGHALIAAPTGSGKTLAAFLAALDRLFRAALAGELGQQTRVLYVSPLKALSNDIHRNLEEPLAGIRDQFQAMGYGRLEVTAAVRTGDTSASERSRISRNPPHILVTTPESFYLMLTSVGGRQVLSTVETIIVDEIHALVGNRRGAHLALSIERLRALVGKPLQRIGLSATQKPIEQVARFLVGTHHLDANDRPDCAIIDEGHLRELDLDLEFPDAPLEAVMSNEVWEEVYRRLVELIESHRTTLIFTNTRRLAERISFHLASKLGDEAVTSHHGSLSLRNRHRTERGLKEGRLRAVVATASLELGIDIGHIDLVCQLGSPRSVSTFLQRIGRSGHYHGGVPKGRLFPLTRDELAECAALVHCTRRGELDELQFQRQPLDVLCQQVVAAVACEDWSLEALHQLVRGAWLYRDLDLQTFSEVVYMLADGFDTRRGRRGAHLHYDGVNGILRARKGARMAAITNGGAIPDNADYSVLLQPEGTFIGTINEDFAVESTPGDIFQLGNHSWRITKVELGRVLVADAEGQPPTIPFWLGEAPARSEALSAALARMRDEVDEVLERGDSASAYLAHEYRLHEAGAELLGTYLEAGRRALGHLPSQRTLVIERFFDETGGMQMVIHSPFGARLNRAWGLSLRKRFCRSFNFELQAAANDDAIVLSLGPKHSFPLEDVYAFLNAKTVRDVLVQALLDAPMFQTRWRWNATRALAMLRSRGGKRVPPAFQRMDADDLLAVIFPDQQACLENIAGDREVPDHLLVHQTIDDCLHEFMDLDGLIRLLQAIQNGSVRTLAVDLPEPSPLAHEILSAKPYAFLDDAPLEERRTQAVTLRRGLDPAHYQGAGYLDVDVIDLVRAQARPDGGSAEEVHEALQLLGAMTAADAECAQPEWQAAFAELVAAGRAGVLRHQGPQGERDLYVAAENLPCWKAALTRILDLPKLTPPARERQVDWSPEAARLALLRRRLEICGPTNISAMAELFGFDPADVELVCYGLESEGVLMRGQFDPRLDEGGKALQFCDRRLLARIHQLTIGRLRARIKPVPPTAFMRFLLAWQHVAPKSRVRGVDGLHAVIEQLEGFEAAAGAWETELLRIRCHVYLNHWLDELCMSGQVGWGRLNPPRGKRSGGSGPIRTTPICLFLRENADVWCTREEESVALKGYAAQVYETLNSRGALFFFQIAEQARLLPTQVEMGLAELVALGMAHADSFAGLRALLVPAARKPKLSTPSRRRFATAPDVRAAGRWSILTVDGPNENEQEAWAEDVLEVRARVLLRRWGVVFRKLLEREPNAPRWRDLLEVYRRLEARGEVRGGRFVDGFSGEQFALPEAIAPLRAAREESGEGELYILNGFDPLNLAGILTPGETVSRQFETRLLCRDGQFLAALENERLVRLTPAADALGDDPHLERLLRQAPNRLESVALADS